MQLVFVMLWGKSTVWEPLGLTVLVRQCEAPRVPGGDVVRLSTVELTAVDYLVAAEVKNSTGLGVSLSWESACLAHMDSWDPPTAKHKLSGVYHTWNQSTLEVEAGEWEVQGHPELQMSLSTSWTMRDFVWNI